MISEREAVRIVRENILEGEIKKIAEYKNFWLFIIFTSDPYEEQMDPFYSVDKSSGDFKGFPYMKEEYFDDVMSLFE